LTREKTQLFDFAAAAEWEFRVFWRRIARYFSKGDSPLRVACRLGWKIMVSKGMALECSLIYFIPIRLPADILLAKDKIPVKPLSGNNTHSNRDAGLHGAGRIMVGYLKHILAILSRSSSMLAPMRCKQPRKASDFFFQEAQIPTGSIVFRIWTPIRQAISWF
jgi:hypothetical protein